MLHQNKLKSQFASHSTIKTNRKEAMYAYNIHVQKYQFLGLSSNMATVG